VKAAESGGVLRSSVASMFRRGPRPARWKNTSSSATCASPSSSQGSSKSSAVVLTYSRREALMRCSYSCATVAIVTVRTKLFDCRLPFTIPLGSGTSR
jgi:hypothetical protein